MKLVVIRYTDMINAAAVTRYVRVDAAQLAATRAVDRSPDDVWAALEPLLGV